MTEYTPRITTRTWQCAEWIGQWIANGKYTPGERIDPDKLRTELGVSRTAFREALRLMEGKGMLTARPNSGTRVTDPVTWNLTDADVCRWLTPSNIGRMFQNDAYVFHAFLASRPDLKNNLFFKNAYDAATAVQKEKQ